MKKPTKAFYLALTVAMLGSVAGVSAAQAQTLESVRVRLPNGQTLSLDSNNWQRDRRVVEYHRYYYEPRERVYVVYNDNHHHHGKKFDKKHNGKKHKGHKHDDRHHGHSH